MTIYFPSIIAFFTITATRSSRVLLALFALQLDAPPAMIGLLAGTFSVPPMLLAYSIGKLSDRFGSRWPLTVGIIGSTLGMTVPLLFPNLPALFVAALLNGVGFAFFNVSLQNAIGLMSTPENRVKNFANFTLIVAFGQFLGPIIAGFSVDLVGAARSCLVVASINSVAAVLLLFGGGGLPAGTGKARQAGENILNLLREDSVRRVLVIGSLMLTGYDLFFYYMPIYLHGINLSASAIGIIVGAFSAGGLLVRVALPRLIARLGVEGVLTRAFLFGAATIAIIPLVQNAIALGIISFAFGLAMNVGQPISMALSFSNAADGRSGEAMGLRQTINHFTRVVGPLFFGSTGSLLGVASVFWINAAMLAGASRLCRKGRLGSVDNQ